MAQKVGRREKLAQKVGRREKLAQKVGRREKLAQKVGGREIYPPVPPPSHVSYVQTVTCGMSQCFRSVFC